MNFKYAAQSYLDEYLRIDCGCMEVLHGDLSHLDESPCKAVADIAAQYSIARTLPKVDEPYRLSFAIEELQGTPRPSADDLEEVVVDFAKRLKKRYEAKGLPLSASSKLLWMKYQHPVVIYDSLAFEWANRQRTSKKALETYGQFVEVWRLKFIECEAEIRDACDALTYWVQRLHISCRNV